MHGNLKTAGKITLSLTLLIGFVTLAAGCDEETVLRGVIEVLESEYPGGFDRFADGDDSPDGSSDPSWEGSSGSGSNGGSVWDSRDDVNGATPISIP